ncbi:hypothetical protein HOC80_04795 [archaeon]|jgi:hypothetical protein|nr:hypothetical protein [archaeon]MBT4417391.1 hypothetical protein [archaeon]
MAQIEKAGFDLRCNSEHEYLVVSNIFDGYIRKNQGQQIPTNDPSLLGHIYGCTVFLCEQETSEPELKIDIHVRILGEHKPLVDRIETELTTIFGKYLQ